MQGQHLLERQSAWRTATQLLEHVKQAAVIKPQPEIHIRADKETRYEAVGRVIYTIQRGGLVKVGFITEPDHGIRRHSP